MKTIGGLRLWHRAGPVTCAAYNIVRLRRRLPAPALQPRVTGTHDNGAGTLAIPIQNVTKEYVTQAQLRLRIIKTLRIPQENENHTRRDRTSDPLRARKWRWTSASTTRCWKIGKLGASQGHPSVGVEAQVRARAVPPRQRVASREASRD